MSNLKTAIMSTAYLGPVSYYCRLFSAEHVVLEQHEHYLKQTYRSRCIIAAPDGRQALTIPIVGGASSHTEIKDIEIAGHGNWQHLHWQALVTAYENSPYFEYYADDFRSFYERPYRFLMDLNEEIRETVCRLIGIDVEPTRTAHYLTTDDVVAMGSGVEDTRSVISPKYRQADANFRPARYYQVFEQRLGFLPDLSIADLLFNMGPEALIVLRDSYCPTV